MDIWLPGTKRYSTGIIIPVSIGVILITAPLLATCVPSLRFRVHIAFIPLRQCLSSIPTARFHRSLCVFCKYIPKSFFNLFSKPNSVYTTYPDPVSEEAYWASAFSGQRELASSNTNTRPGTAIPGLIVYYAPALLPTYRDGDKASMKGVEGRLVYISPRTFLEWHRMVFPDSVHPTLDQASRRRWNFSDRDRREMRRIVKMGRRAVPRHAEDQHQRAVQYREMWRRWVEGKDNQDELVVTFA